MIRTEYRLTWQHGAAVNVPEGDGWEPINMSAASYGDQESFDCYAAILWRRNVSTPSTTEKP